METVNEQKNSDNLKARLYNKLWKSYKQNPKSKSYFTPYEFILITVIWWGRFQDVWYGRYLN